ncbi:MAG: hypothetical protein GY903_01080 [Fuerstiella sp.]|nr:hypothetical protein [Fuerstiella sp.]MCP4853071.1 hypothetical protein [Fuerstiella sp.]
MIDQHKAATSQDRAGLPARRVHLVNSPEELQKIGSDSYALMNDQLAASVPEWQRPGCEFVLTRNPAGVGGLPAAVQAMSGQAIPSGVAAVIVQPDADNTLMREVMNRNVPAYTMVRPDVIYQVFYPEMRDMAAVEDIRRKANEEVDEYMRQDWQPVQQSVHSEGTSLDQIPSLHKHIAGQLRGVNLDMGGGAYDKATQFLAQHGVKNLVYDPYNRPAQHNQQVMAAVAGGRADSVTIANVLNVIPEPAAQLQTLKEAADALKPGGTVYIDVYPGNGSGHPEKTSKGFQQNKPLQAYLPLVQQVFPQAKLTHSMIVAQNGGGQQQNYARVSDLIEQYAKLGPAAGQKNLFTPQVTKSGAMKKRWQEELHPRTGKGVGDGGKFQSKHGGGQHVRVVDHGTHHVAHVQHPRTGQVHQFKGHDHAHAVRTAAKGANNLGFVIEPPKEQPEMGGLFAGQQQPSAGAKKPQAAPPKPATGPQHTSPPPPRPKAQGGLFDQPKQVATSGQSPHVVGQKHPKTGIVPLFKGEAEKLNDQREATEPKKHNDALQKKLDALREEHKYVPQDPRGHHPEKAMAIKEENAWHAQQAGGAADQQKQPATSGQTEKKPAASIDPKGQAPAHAKPDHAELVKQAQGWNHSAREHEGTLPDNKAKLAFSRTTGKSDLDKWLMKTHGVSDTDARAASNKAGEEGPAPHAKLPATHWSHLPKEGDRKTEGEHTYVLKSGRWHRSDGEGREWQQREVTVRGSVNKPEHKKTVDVRVDVPADQLKGYMSDHGNPDWHGDAPSGRHVGAAKKAINNLKNKNPLFADQIEDEEGSAEERAERFHSIKRERLKATKAQWAKEWDDELDSLRGLTPEQQAEAIRQYESQDLHSGSQNTHKLLPDVVKLIKSGGSIEDDRNKRAAVFLTDAFNHSKNKELPAKRIVELHGKGVKFDPATLKAAQEIHAGESAEKNKQAKQDEPFQLEGKKSEWEVPDSQKPDLPNQAPAKAATQSALFDAGKKEDLPGQEMLFDDPVDSDNSKTAESQARAVNPALIHNDVHVIPNAGTVPWTRLSADGQLKTLQVSARNKRLTSDHVDALNDLPRGEFKLQERTGSNISDTSYGKHHMAVGGLVQLGLIDMTDNGPGMPRSYKLNAEGAKAVENWHVAQDQLLERHKKAAGKKDPHADALKRAEEFTEYGPTYDRNIATSYGRYMNAKERGHSQQMLDGLHGELKMRLDARDARAGDAGITELKKHVDADGIEHKMFTSAKDPDGHVRVRMRDTDSGENVGIKTFPSQEAAEKAFAKNTKAASNKEFDDFVEAGKKDKPLSMQLDEINDKNEPEGGWSDSDRVPMEQQKATKAAGGKSPHQGLLNRADWHKEDKGISAAAASLQEAIDEGYSPEMQKRMADQLSGKLERKNDGRMAEAVKRAGEEEKNKEQRPMPAATSDMTNDELRAAAAEAGKTKQPKEPKGAYDPERREQAPASESRQKEYEKQVAEYGESKKRASEIKDQLKHNDRVGRGEATAAVKATAASDTPSSDAVKKTDGHREAAQHYYDAQKHEDYAWARKSDVDNVGADLAGAARHVRNEWRTLEDLEAMGAAVAEKGITRSNLQKRKPNNFAVHAEKNPMTALAMHFAMNTIPQRPYGTKSNEAKGTSLDGMNADEFRASTRKQYVEMFDALHAKAEELAGGDMGPSEALHEFARFADSHRNKLTKGGYSQTVRTTYDALKKIHKQTRTAKNYKDKFSLDPSQDNYRFKSNTAIHKMREFAKLAQEHHGRFDGGDDVQQKAIDVISGSTVASVFGKKVAGGNKNAEKFNPSEAYVTGVSNRKGGRKVNTSSHGKTQKMLMGGMTIRGLQYGNSMTDDERVHHTAKSAEAFVDLADALGVPDEAIGMKGKLGLAFGARGRAGAKAHFESAGNVINMTRKNGSGSLAHEWAHFLDFNSGERMGTAASSQRNDNHKKLQTAWAAAKQRIGESVRERYEGFSAKVRQKEYEYWTSDVEMFARYSERLVQSNLHKEGRDNTYLVGLNKSGHSWWPSDAELEKARPHLEAIYSEFGKKWEGEHGKVERKERYERIRALRDGDSYQRADITAFVDKYFRDEWWVYTPEPSLSAAVDQYAQRTLGQLAVHGAADMAISPWGKSRAFNRMIKSAFGAWQDRNAGQQSPQHTALEKRHGLDAGQGHRMLQEHARRSARAELKGQGRPQAQGNPQQGMTQGQQRRQAEGSYYEPPAPEWKGPPPSDHPDADPQKLFDFNSGPAAPAPEAGGGSSRPGGRAPAASYRAGTSPGLDRTAAGVPTNRREGGGYTDSSQTSHPPAEYRPGSIGDRLQRGQKGIEQPQQAQQQPQPTAADKPFALPKGIKSGSLEAQALEYEHKSNQNAAKRGKLPPGTFKPAPARPPEVQGPEGPWMHIPTAADRLDREAAERGETAGSGRPDPKPGSLEQQGRRSDLEELTAAAAKGGKDGELAKQFLQHMQKSNAASAPQAPATPSAGAVGPSNKPFEELHPRGKEGHSDGGKFVKKGQEEAGSPTDQAPPPQLSPEQVHHIRQQKAAQAAAIEHKKSVEMEPLGVRVNGEKPDNPDSPYAGTALDLATDMGKSAQKQHRGKIDKGRAMQAWEKSGNISTGGGIREVMVDPARKNQPAILTSEEREAALNRSAQVRRELADRDARNTAQAEFQKLPKAAAAAESGLAEPQPEDFTGPDGRVNEISYTDAEGNKVEGYRDAMKKWQRRERQFDNRRQDQHQDRIKAAATSAGVDPVELHQIAQQTHEMHMAQHKEWAPIVRQAQGLVSKSKAENIENSRDRAGAGDYSNIPGFDDMLDEMMNNAPHLSWGDNPSDTLWQKIKGGGRTPTVSDDHILKESVDYLTRQNSSPAAAYGDPEGYEPPDHSGGYDPDDPDAVPFSRHSDMTAVLDRYMRPFLTSC